MGVSTNAILVYGWVSDDNWGALEYNIEKAQGADFKSKLEGIPDWILEEDSHYSWREYLPFPSLSYDDHCSDGEPMPIVYADALKGEDAVPFLDARRGYPARIDAELFTQTFGVDPLILARWTKEIGEFLDWAGMPEEKDNIGWHLCSWWA